MPARLPLLIFFVCAVFLFSGCTALKQRPQSPESIVPLPPQVPPQGSSAAEQAPRQTQEQPVMKPSPPLQAQPALRTQTAAAKGAQKSDTPSTSGASHSWSSDSWPSDSSPDSGASSDFSRSPSGSGASDFGPRQGEPPELAALLTLKASAAAHSPVAEMRPNALREAAQLVTLQTAIAWRYGALMAIVDQHAGAMDQSFNFSPLMMTHGDALIMPPVLTRAGASLRVEEGMTATAAATSYELLEPARYISVAPTWRAYLMADDFPQPEKPNPAVLPRNSKERAIWQEAVRESWGMGVEQADQMFLDNVSRMVRDYRGIMLYHLLSAQSMMSRVSTASADLGVHIKDNKMHLAQKVYRITSPSEFTVPSPEPYTQETDSLKPRRGKTGGAAARTAGRYVKVSTSPAQPLLAQAASSASTLTPASPASDAQGEQNQVPAQVDPEPAPPAATYKITPGRLKAQMTAWTAQADYQLVWLASNDYEMYATADFSSDFQESVRALFAGLQRSGYPLRIAVWTTNKVLEVTEN